MPRENYTWKIINLPKVNPKPVKPALFTNLLIGTLLFSILALLAAILKIDLLMHLIYQKKQKKI